MITGGPGRDALRRVLLLLILLVAIGRVMATYRVFSQTADEDIHIAAGYKLLKTGEYNVDGEHPPLSRILVGLHAWLTAPDLTDRIHGLFPGNDLLYREGGYRRNLSRARAGNLPFFIVALVVTGLWTRRLFGPWPAVVAVALLASVPPVLGHAGLATTDMAATAGTVAAVYAFSLWLEKPSWRNAAILAAGVTFGLATKFSVLMYIPVAAIALAVPEIVRRRVPLAIGRRSAHVAITALFAIVCMWALYRFDTGTIREARVQVFPAMMPQHIAARYAGQPGYGWIRSDLLVRFYDYANEAARDHDKTVDIVDWGKAYGYPSPDAGRRGNTLEGLRPVTPETLEERMLEPLRAAYQWFTVNVRVPAPLFVAGAELARAHAEMGHPGFLLGDKREDGWWYYFPVVFFFKSTIPFVVFSVAGVVLCLIDRRAIGLVPIAMFIPPMASAINIGIRHILPIFPFLAICAAYAVSRMWTMRWSRIAAIALLVWHFVAGALAHPDYMAYFNEAAGPHPERIALDSNLDWGQDMNRLVDLVRREKIPRIYIAYFGHADWRRHHITAEELAPFTPTHGWIAVSEMKFFFGSDGLGRGYEWLEKRPYRRVGKSIRLYYVP